MSPEEFKTFIDENMKHNWREARIVNKLWDALRRNGTQIIGVYDGEETVMVKTKREMQEQVFNLDECFLIVRNGNWVRITMGNGWDALTDYTTDLDDVILPIHAWIEKQPGY